MPDGDLASRSPRQEMALASVDALLSTLAGDTRPLLPTELAEYGLHRFIAGWRVSVEFASMSGALALDILADGAFPYSPVRIGLLDRAASRGWPHVETNMVLCLLPNSASIDVDAPVHVVRNQLSDACSLVEASLAGTNRDDFLSEVGSYWTRILPAPPVGLRTLVMVGGPSRMVKVWRARGFDLVGDDGEACLRWLRHMGVKADARNLGEGLFLWMDRPPYPDEYPGTGAGLRALVEARCPDGLPLLEAQAARDPADLVVLFGSRTGDGAVLLGATVSRGAPPQRPRANRNPSSSGFSGRVVPSSVAVPRFLGSATVLRRLPTRVDPAWIHGRDLDAGARTLGDMKVAVLGCGSVGGPVAVRLAQAGVGSLFLVDGDLLSSANVGRHPLGVDDLHRSKSVALADDLRKRYPHLRAVEGIDADWMTAHAERSDLLGSCDLIVGGDGGLDIGFDAERLAHRPGETEAGPVCVDGGARLRGACGADHRRGWVPALRLLVHGYAVAPRVRVACRNLGARTGMRGRVPALRAGGDGARGGAGLRDGHRRPAVPSTRFHPSHLGGPPVAPDVDRRQLDPAVGRTAPGKGRRRVHGPVRLARQTVSGL